MQRRCGWLPGRAIDMVCNVAELNRSNRPAAGVLGMPFPKQPFTPWQTHRGMPARYRYGCLSAINVVFVP
jgi:hypothetical protein